MPNLPVESMQLRFAYTSARVDVSIWEGREREGKPLPSNVSLRITETDKNAVYLNAEDALAIANVLQQFAFKAMKRDSERRLAAWKKREKNKLVEDLG